jgi:hypothetical protein
MSGWKMRDGCTINNVDPYRRSPSTNDGDVLVIKLPKIKGRLKIIEHKKLDKLIVLGIERVQVYKIICILIF